MYRRIVFVFAVCLSLTCSLSAQEVKGAPQGAGQQTNVYASLVYHSTSDFPLTQNFSMYSIGSSAFRSSASSIGLAVGAGTTMFSSRQGYGGLELGFLRTSFSDPNVTGKPFYFFDLFLHFGLSPWADGRSAFYAIFGGALVYHSDEGEDLGGLTPVAGGWDPSSSFSNPPDYYLAKYVGAVMWGVGARMNVVSDIIVSVEYKWMYDSSAETDFSQPVPGMSGWYYGHSKFDPIGNRLSVGISYVIYSEHP
jgi:hypothetical protein